MRPSFAVTIVQSPTRLRAQPTDTGRGPAAHGNDDAPPRPPASKHTHTHKHARAPTRPNKTPKHPNKTHTGTEFDSSFKRNQPFQFKLGAGMVIKGWDQGLEGACVGEKRTLRIPASLGYGASGAGGVIPGGATLIFETEMMGIN